MPWDKGREEDHEQRQQMDGNAPRIEFSRGLGPQSHGLDLSRHSVRLLASNLSFRESIMKPALF